MKKGRRFPAPVQDTYMYLARHLHDAQGRCMITFSERVDVERMSRALFLTMEAEPVLACRFVVHPWRPFWQMRDDLERISRCAESNSTEVEKDSLQYLAEPIDLLQDPQIQLKLFRGRQDVLCLKLNHMVTDGSGFVEYIRLLSQTYRELGKNPDYRPGYPVSASRGQWQIFRHVSIRRTLQAGLAFSLPASSWELPASSRDYSRQTLLVRPLPATAVEALKSHSRQNHASMNVLLHTAFFRALCELLDSPFGRELSIQTTVNLRQHLPPNHSSRICNLAGIFFLNLARIRKEPFAATLNRMQLLFDRARQEQPWLGGAIGLEASLLAGFVLAEKIFRFHQKRMVTRGAVQPILANLGHINTSMIDFGDNQVSDLALIGPIPYSSTVLLTVHAFNGRMNLTTGYSPAAIDPSFMARFLDLFAAELPL